MIQDLKKKDSMTISDLYLRSNNESRRSVKRSIGASHKTRDSSVHWETLRFSLLFGH